MKYVRWNTGRYYGPDGQRIIAWQCDGMIYFQDVDRGIGGKFPHPEIELDGIKHVVMDHYDRNIYTDHYDYNLKF